MRRACVFVDGENFRHSLKHLFPSGRYSFGKGDYLPETDWHAFFTSLADRFDCELLAVEAKVQAKPGRSKDFADGVGHALRRAAKDARRIARMYGTPICVWRNGKVVAQKP